MRKLKLTEKKNLVIKPQGNFRSHLTQLILDIWLFQKKEKMIDSQKLILLPVKRTVLEILTASAILIIIISL